MRLVQLYYSNMWFTHMITTCDSHIWFSHVCSIPQLAHMISRALEWDIDHVQDVLSVRLYCSTRVRHGNGETRNYWATERHYPYNKGVRRDMVEIDLSTKKKINGQVVHKKKTGVAQLVAFITLRNLPDDCPFLTAKCVLIRWMSPSSRSRSRDDEDRPLCEYPLCNNHCFI